MSPLCIEKNVSSGENTGLKPLLDPLKNKLKAHLCKNLKALPSFPLLKRVYVPWALSFVGCFKTFKFETQLNKTRHFNLAIYFANDKLFWLLFLFTTHLPKMLREGKAQRTGPEPWCGFL